MTETNEIEVLVADASHIGYVDEILDTINRAAKIFDSSSWLPMQLFRIKSIIT